MKKYKIAADEKDHFMIDQGDGPFKVAKKGLTKGMQMHIRKYAFGDEVTALPAQTSEGNWREMLAKSKEEKEREESTPEWVQKRLSEETTNPLPTAAMAVPTPAVSPPPQTQVQPAPQTLVPNTMPQLPGGYASHEKEAKEAEQQGLKAIEEKRKYAVQEAEQTLPIRQAEQQGIDDINRHHDMEKISRDYNREKLRRQIVSSEIDPNKLWHNANIGQKASATIGLILGGIGAGLTHGPNMAMQMMDNVIAQDIDAQKTNLANKRSDYKDLLQEGYDADHAREMAISKKEHEAAAQIERLKLSLTDPRQQAAADAASAQLKAQSAARAETVDFRRRSLKLQELHIATNLLIHQQAAQAKGQQTAAQTQGLLEASADADKVLKDPGLKEAISSSIFKTSDAAFKNKIYPVLQTILQMKGGKVNDRAITRRVDTVAESMKGLSPEKRQSVINDLITEKALAEHQVRQGKILPAFSVEAGGEGTSGEQ